jgi:hypothetical protein
MKTLVTYRKQTGGIYQEIVNCHNPSSAAATLFLLKPNLRTIRVEIINCIGIIGPFQVKENHQKNIVF